MRKMNFISTSLNDLEIKLEQSFKVRYLQEVNSLLKKDLEVVKVSFKQTKVLFIAQKFN